MRRIAWMATFSFAVLPNCQSGVDQLRVQSAFAIQNGLDFVASSQTPTGGFITDCWHVDAPEQKTPVDAVFTASQVLYSLSFCQDSASARGTEERAAKYLATQQEPPGVWHYYGTGTPLKISPDVDDTSVAWAALQRLETPVPPSALDAVRASRDKDGLFTTWIGPAAGWINIDSRDVDTVVNMNALLLFGLAHENMDAICKYVIAQIDNDNFRRGTVYYRSPLMFAHAFSRAYREGNVKCLEPGIGKLRDTVLSMQNPDGSWGNDLETAFGALTLLNLNYRGDELDRAIKILVTRQSSDGGWELAPAYRGAVQPLNYGARALTTAVVIEALAKYSTQQ
ncbi:MAG TPA: prenyltransferase/squalene oxidase repeat-containing protein [Chthoniobacterales bacterium]|nr:prenyltransferase/squalene oxidase repeat-containing protein [Chthoniobacterales bacterium]